MEQKQERRSKGICFSCDEKLTRDNACKMKQKYMLCQEEEGDEAVEDGEQFTREDAVKALTRNAAVLPMIVLGHIKGQEVIVVIGSGTPYNFVSDKLVTELNLSTQHINEFSAAAGNGRKMSCSRVCGGVLLEMQGYQTTLDLYPATLGSIDLLLGVQWLEGLGTVICNWRTMAMEFMSAGKQYRLQGLKKGRIEQGDCSELGRIEGQQAFLFFLQ